MKILLLTDRDEFAGSMSSLVAFGNSLTRGPLSIASSTDCQGPQCVLVDGTTDRSAARESCRRVGAWAPAAALLAVVTADDFAAVGLDWHVDDVLIATAGPAEANARLRMALQRRNQFTHHAVQFGDLVIQTDSYTASLSGRDLDLTLTEFRLLNHLVRHPGQAFTRTRLLRDIWGGTGSRRKVDVHVQRLRAKLGPDHESIVDTVRGVGYMTPAAPDPPWALAN